MFATVVLAAIQYALIYFLPQYMAPAGRMERFRRKTEIMDKRKVLHLHNRLPYLLYNLYKIISPSLLFRMTSVLSYIYVITI